MENYICRPLIQAQTNQTLTLVNLAIIWGALLILMGLFYRTFDIAMASTAMEFSRQVGTSFIVVEIAVTIFAVSNGLKFAYYWNALSPLTRGLAVTFFSTFWVSAMFVSVAPSFSMMLNVGVIAHILFAVSVYHLLGSVDRNGLNRMRIVFVAMMILFTFMIFYQFKLVTPPRDLLTWQFAIPGFISIRLFGAVCGALVAFCLMMTLVDEETHCAKHWHYLGLTFILGLTIWTGTRAAVLGVVCALVIAVGFYRLRPSSVVVIKLCASLVVAAMVAQMFAPADPIFVLFVSGEYSSLDTASAGRLGLWKATWEAFLTVPIFGAGPGANSWILPSEMFRHVQPHNVVLQFLVNWGLAGALPAFGLLGIATWHAHRICCAAAIFSLCLRCSIACWQCRSSMASCILPAKR